MVTGDFGLTIFDKIKKSMTATAKDIGDDYKDLGKSLVRPIKSSADTITNLISKMETKFEDLGVTIEDVAEEPKKIAKETKKTADKILGVLFAACLFCCRPGADRR